MVKKLRVAIVCCLLLILFISSCAQATPMTTPQVINLYATQAAQPWLTGLYDCAERLDVIIRLTDQNKAQINLRVGEPAILVGFAYQLGEEELVLALNSQNSLNFLSQAQILELFSGQIGNWQVINTIDAPVQVWVFAKDSDLGQVFNRSVLEAGRITSMARLASAGEEMRAEIAQNVTAIGYIGRHSVGSDIRSLSFEQPILAPVLAIATEEPTGYVKDVLVCAQQKTAP